MASRRTIKRRLLAEASLQAGRFSGQNPAGIRGASIGGEEGLQFGVGEGGEFEVTGGLLDAGPDQGALDILEQLRQEDFTSNLGRLESRLIGQGRLGLGTGERGANPELAGFFGANQRGKLQDRLAAFGIKARRRGQLLQGLFNTLGFGERASNRIGDRRFDALQLTAGQRGGGFGRGLLSAAIPIGAALAGNPGVGALFSGGGPGTGSNIPGGQEPGDFETQTGFFG